MNQPLQPGRAPNVYDDALSDAGALVLFAAKPDAYQELARAKVLDGKCWTVPVLSNKSIYCRNAAGDLVCVDVQISKAQ